MPHTFSSPTHRGSNRGASLGSPTLNLDISAVPSDMQDGVYACRVKLDGEQEWRHAVLHWGTRPTFGDVRSCEVHLLDQTLATPPEQVTVQIAGRLRDIQVFPDADALRAQIAKDIAAARAILANDASSAQEGSS